ncbi:Uncharacterized protein HZ326_22552 [Fusarium oxysporum f. sp. albedinis]|nr:Uncharacterized protein HZ326_22552 [Fusarium oxysporum f. sp. albedinis]
MSRAMRRGLTVLETVLPGRLRRFKRLRTFQCLSRALPVVSNLLLIHYHLLRSAHTWPFWAPLPWSSQKCAFQGSFLAFVAWVTTVASDAAEGTSITGP